MIQEKEDQNKFNRIIELVNEYNPGKIPGVPKEEDQPRWIDININKYN